MAEDTYTVERSTSISAPPEKVFSLIADFHKWPDWSPWEDLDPNMQRVYNGEESGVGAMYEWEGNRRAGEGRMEIVEVEEPKKVEIDLTFVKPFKAENKTRFDLAGEGDSTEVTWTMTGKKTLGTKIIGIFKSMDKMIGPDFEEGLRRLKAKAEGPDEPDKSDQPEKSEDSEGSEG